MYNNLLDTKIIINTIQQNYTIKTIMQQSGSNWTF